MSEEKSEYRIEERDAKGRIVRRTAGVAPPGAGRPSDGDLQRLRAALLEAADPETLERFVTALRRKLAKGNLQAATFLFDRLQGKPAVSVSHDLNPQLGAFMAAWVHLIEPAGEGENKDGAAGKR